MNQTNENKSIELTHDNDKAFTHPKPRVKRYYLKKKSHPDMQRNNSSSQKHPHQNVSKNVAEKQQEHTQAPIEKAQLDPFSFKNQLFSFIRQKTGTSPQNFIELLNSVLENESFETIQTDNDHDLFAYSILYENEFVFCYFIEHFSQYLKKDIIENKLLALSMNKQPVFLEKILKNSENFGIKPTQSIVLKAAKMSYRKECNEVFLNWISPYHEEVGEYFWEVCLQEHNVALYALALFTSLKEVLRKNFHLLESRIEQMGKLHITKQALSPKSFIKTQPSTILQSDSDMPVENVKNIKLSKENKKELFAENKKTEIIVKRKKVLPN